MNQNQGIKALIACVGLASGAAAQSVRWSEGFENVGADAGGGPANLVTGGWIFRNQSSPLGSGPARWYEGPPQFGTWGSYNAHAGENYIMTDQGSAVGVGGAASNWMILPAVPGMGAGDAIEFWFRGFPNPPADRLEVRLSPGGGTSTGSGASSVGDFTVLLHSEDALDESFLPMDGQWNFITVPITSGGRLALRYYSPSAIVGGSGAVWAVDDVQVVASPPAEPPYPSAGQTVHWTTAMSPVRIPADRTIPAGGTVVVDAGVTLNIVEGASVTVAGALLVQGSAGARASLQAGGAGPAQGRLIIGSGGQATIEHADVGCWVEPLAGDVFGTPAGDLTARHCTFGDGGRILTNGYVVGTPSVLVVEDCAFDSPQAFWHQACQARLRSVSIAGGDVGLLLLGHVNLDQVSADGAGVWIGDNRYGGQPQFLDNLSITNVPTRSGLLLDSRNYLLGPNVSIQNTAFPVEFGASGATGLLPGSHVPATGNTDNVVLDTSRDFPTAVMGAVWAPLDVPYVIPGGALRATGDIDVLPGARIVLGQGTLWEWFGHFNAEGTPDRPIIFESADASLRWGSLVSRTSLARLDHCVVRGGVTGIQTLGGNVRVSNMTFNDLTGAALFASDGSIWEVTKSRFFGNATALLRSFDFESGSIDADGTLAPNSIEGNARGAASRYSLFARDNWWGHASGPFDPLLNPGGQGDPVEGGGTLYRPFLAAAPDFSDTPPTVRIVDTRHRIFEPGSRVIIHWTAADDGRIARQRVLYSPNDQRGTHQVVAELPAWQRSFEWVVPADGFAGNDIQTFRVEAEDDSGQTGWDQQVCVIPRDTAPGTMEITTPLGAQHEFGEAFGTTWTQSGWPAADMPSVYGRLVFENDFTWQDLGGSHAHLGALSGTQFMGNVSTDFARLHVVAARGAFQSQHYFSRPFAIRPDPRMGDAPPVISVSSPGAGSSYAGGSIVPLRWDASDDEGVRSFDVIASYDGGRWYYPVVRDLPATATGYDWQLPPSGGIPGVRVRVIVKDRRFQNSSGEVEFSISPGTGACAADLDDGSFTGTPDGGVTVDDLVYFLDRFGAGDVAADLDNGTMTGTRDGGVTIDDLLYFLARFDLGC